MAANFGGYDYNFVEQNLERFTCDTICTRVLKDPHLTVCCGQHFCESCLSYWFIRHHKESCPHCRAEGRRFQHFLDKKLKREIDSLRIHCTNKEEGCQWIGELGSLKDHLKSANGCGYVEVECPNGCINTIKRNKLGDHLGYECYFRPYWCEYCTTFKDTYWNICNFHYDQCPEFPLECPNGCGRNDIKRKDMKHHCSRCPEEKIECPNKCPPDAHHKKLIKRKNLDRHITNECILRPFKCDYCYKRFPWNILPTHYKECPEICLQCPNECTVRNIKRKNMEYHRSQCPKQPVQCPFEEVGCKEQLVQRDLEQHMSANQQQHLLMVMGAYKEMKNENEELKQAYLSVTSAQEDTLQELQQIKKELKRSRKRTGFH